MLLMSSYSTVLDLHKRFGQELTWFVPLGMKSWMDGCGIHKVVELSWWEEQSLQLRGQEVKFACVPAAHWSNRGVMDQNKVLFFSFFSENETVFIYNF
jgi:N-acyl-phosphatidylethanolamine-hydrolysing phospholipase D